MRLNQHENTSRDYDRANRLRLGASPVEQKLWRKLRETASARGLKFRRQQTIHPYIADFACLKARLLIELDGATHDRTVNYDKAREHYLRQQGYSVLRFSNQDVTQNIDAIVETIIAWAESEIRHFKNSAGGCPPTPNPAPQGGREPHRTRVGIARDKDTSEC